MVNLQRQKATTEINDHIDPTTIQIYMYYCKSVDGIRNRGLLG